MVLILEQMRLKRGLGWIRFIIEIVIRDLGWQLLLSLHFTYSINLEFISNSNRTFWKVHFSLCDYTIFGAHKFINRYYSKMKRQLQNLKDQLLASVLKQQIARIRNTGVDKLLKQHKKLSHNQNDQILEQLYHLRRHVNKLTKSVSKIIRRESPEPQKVKVQRSDQRNSRVMRNSHAFDSHQVKQCMVETFKKGEENRKSQERKRRQSLWKDSYDQMYTKHQDLYKNLVVSRR